MKNSDPNNAQQNGNIASRATSTRRNQEIEDWLNRNIYHPLAYRLAQKLSKTSITPNMLSLAGGLLVILAAYIYTMPNWPMTTIFALLLHMSWHVIDGADGDLARMTGKAGPLGEVIDGLSDYLSHIILYCTLAVLLTDQIGAFWAWVAALGAGASRIIQANHYEMCRRQYQWWVYGKSWLGEVPILPKNIWGHMASWCANLYMSLGKHNNKSFAYIDNRISASQNSAHAKEQIKQAAIEHLLPYLATIRLLGANYRTIILGIAMLCGSPLWYFIFEIIIINAILIYSLAQYNKAIKYFKNIMF